MGRGARTQGHLVASLVAAKPLGAVLLLLVSLDFLSDLLAWSMDVPFKGMLPTRPYQPFRSIGWGALDFGLLTFTILFTMFWSPLRRRLCPVNARSFVLHDAGH